MTYYLCYYDSNQIEYDHSVHTIAYGNGYFILREDNYRTGYVTDIEYLEFDWRLKLEDSDSFIVKAVTIISTFESDSALNIFYFKQLYPELFI